MKIQNEINQTQEDISFALTRLREAGYKITQKRKEILEIFAQEQKYLSATYIHDLLIQKYPTMSYNTTYRNIYDFIDSGILESTEYNQEQLFRINCHGPNHHHHHFICTHCGMAIALEFCPMDYSQLDERLTDVTISSHRFEIFGLCAECK